jgi:hypothetical protein
VKVEVEFAGVLTAADLERLAAGEAASLSLAVPAGDARPGLHVIPLHVEYREVPAPDAPRRSQRSFLSLPLGDRPPLALHLRVPPSLLVDNEGFLPVGLESADGAAHRVEVRVLTPLGLVAPDPPPVAALAPGGRSQVPVRLLRGAGQRAAAVGVVVVARVLDGALECAAAATAVVELRADPALAPGLRRPLLAAGLALVGTALGWEVLRRYRGAGSG